MTRLGNGRRQISAAALGVLVLLVAQPAAAQYFGRNKVQYEDFDFRILETPHFDLYYYPAEYDAVTAAARLAERWYERLSVTFDHQLRERQPIVFYGSHAKFTQTTVIPGMLDDGVGGVTEHQKGRVVLPFAASLAETDHVLGHELVHVFQRDILRQYGRSIALLPLWFVEGMAEYVSIGRVDPNTAMWLRDASDRTLPTIEQLNDPKWFPYRYGQALWAYLAGRFGEKVVVECLATKAGGGAVGRLVSATHVDSKTLSHDWHQWIHQVSAASTREPNASGAVRLPADLITGKNSGRLNVSPALSPDGSRLIFLSERDRYSIDVFLADAHTGAVQRRITSTAVDPHFESLEFIDSAGAWNRSGTRFVLAALSGGEPVLTILDPVSGVVEREVRLEELDQAFSPSWSPDGHRLVFSGLAAGQSDVYVFDLDSNRLQRLTNDPFADIQPSWSPDGRTIVFSTDRFSSSLDSLTFGNYRLAAIDLETEAVRELPSLVGAKNIDPHWSADGSSVYFVADRDEISNVYRLTMSDGELAQMTDVTTGVSGVTATSPALAAAASADRLAFSIYRHGAYEIQTITPSEVAPVPVASILASSAASGKANDDLGQEQPLGVEVGPAIGSAGERGEIGATRAAGGAGAGGVGLLDRKDFTQKPYRKGLSLNGIGQPYLSAGGGTLGTFLRVGTALSFGDMLSDQALQAAVQVGKSTNDFALQAAYVNQRSRWNWGIVGGQVPWLTGGLTSPFTSTNDGSLARDTNVFRQLHRQVAGLAIYPFSQSSRVELSAGMHEISFDRQSTNSIYSASTGRLLHETTQSAEAAPSIGLVESRVAFVHDTSVEGVASPILGERYRFEVAPTFGALTFTTVTADYRRYLMPVRPFTLALRVMHVGRYGPDSADERLLPLAWTLRDVVRGYGDLGPAVATACRQQMSTDCGSMGYLGAQKLFVGNAELRFPLVGAFHHSAAADRVPLEGLFFADSAAFSNDTFLDRSSTARGLRSVGGGVRVNAAGTVLEFDAVRPLDLPGGWAFAFNLRRGF